MARPRNPIGTHGVIKIDQVAPGKFRARTRYRFQDGKARQVERFASSGPKAEHALKTALTTIEATRGGEILPTTTLRALSARFIESKRELGRSTGTIESYENSIRLHIIPRLGDITIREANAERLQHFLSAIQTEFGPGAAKHCRTVLSGMLAIAVRNSAAQTNPVRELETITGRRGKKGAKAIPADKLPAFLEAVRGDNYLIERDTVEVIEFMLLTGWRAAEVCGLDIEESVNFEEGTATVEAIAKRVKGKGMIRQQFPKTEGSERTTPLPSAALELLKKRHERLKGFTSLAFPTPLMKLRDPSALQAEIRERRDDLGYPGLSTHTFRKTCAQILDAAGLTAAEVAEYLGHEDSTVTQNVYLARTDASDKAANAVQGKLADLF